jgi:hypothetical protein
MTTSRKKPKAPKPTKQRSFRVLVSAWEVTSDAYRGHEHKWLWYLHHRAPSAGLLYEAIARGDRVWLVVKPEPKRAKRRAKR